MRTSRSLQELSFRSSCLEARAERACRPSWHRFWSRKETLGASLAFSDPQTLLHRQLPGTLRTKPSETTKRPRLLLPEHSPVTWEVECPCQADCGDASNATSPTFGLLFHTTEMSTFYLNCIYFT